MGRGANVLVAAAALSLALGCNKSKDAPEPADRAAPIDIASLRDKGSAEAPVAPRAPLPPGAAITSEADYMAKAHAAIQKQIDLFKHAASCDQLADDIAAYAASADWRAVSAYEEAHPESADKFDASSKDLVVAYKGAAAPVNERCATNHRFLDALQRF